MAGEKNLSVMKAFEWAVVGAGPAGIVALGKLLDEGVEGHSILWVDPHFEAGDFGTKWKYVCSNTPVNLFTASLEAFNSLEYDQSPSFKLKHLDPNATCALAVMGEALQWTTQRLMSKVSTFKGQVESLELQARTWLLTLSEGKAKAKKVILATGAKPKKLEHYGIQAIDLEVAFHPEKLKALDLKNEKVGVFGASHSSLSVLRNLEACRVKRVIHFYSGPLKYAVSFGDWTLFENSGLKGVSADWAREKLDGVQPDWLERVCIQSEEFDSKHAECTRVIDTIGFERAQTVEIKPWKRIEYNTSNGIIAPGLFGLGIAFPQRVCDPHGNVEMNVGIWKFVNYLNQIFPLWSNYPA